jgi:ankyrin repeat protein
MRKILVVLCFVPALSVTVLCGQALPQPQIRSAADRAIAATQHGAAGFYRSMACFSCHDHALPMLAWQTARAHGVPVDETIARQVAAKGLLTVPNLSSIDAAVQDPMIIDPSISDGYALIAAHAAGVKPSLVTAVYARRIANWQRADGQWSTFDVRPPASYSNFTATAVAAYAMQLYMPALLRNETATHVARARAWLVASHPQSTEDSSFRLLGLHWTGAPRDETTRAAGDLLALQRSDGGWGELPHMASDAYSTGEALVALNEADEVPTTNAAYVRGIRYLLSHQDAGGRWHVHTRMVSPAPVSPPYFESGFPYGHDQFLSTAATSWAAAALTLALPQVAKPFVPPPIPELSPKGIEPWMKTAIYGTAAQLKAALDGGLDPNSKTAEGTTLLMMAAQYPVKVKLLVEHGADVSAKAKSGYTALMVAAMYRGDSESVKTLLAHGAQARPGKGVQFDASPLFLAAMAGDRENVALLLKSGADPNRKMSLIGMFPASPLFEAVDFGNTAIVKMLLEGGANIHEKDDDSMTALDWAVVSHRADVARLLLAHGADVNAIDRFGYTPLEYAATIDFGDSDTAKVLLSAGANPNIKDKTGKTPLEQARDVPYLRDALENPGGKP